MEIDDNPALWVGEPEDERRAIADAMSARRWTLNQTLAWIAFHRPDAVAQNEGPAGLASWQGMREVFGRPVEIDITLLDRAWKDLAAALADGVFFGLGTIVPMSRQTIDGGRIERHAPGERMPPADQPGYFMACRLVGDPPIVVPNEKQPVTWREVRDLTFKRQDIMREFPADALTIEGEAERQPANHARIEGQNAAATEAGIGQTAPKLRPGAKPKFDWSEYEKAFLARTEADGWPDEQGAEGWRTQADVARWLQTLAEREKLSMSFEAAKRKAKAFLGHNSAN